MKEVDEYVSEINEKIGCWKKHKIKSECGCTCESHLLLQHIRICRISAFQGGDYEECHFWGVAIVSTNVSEDRITSTIRVERISMLSMLAVTSN
jgi:hypothetical protein